MNGQTSVWPFVTFHANLFIKHLTCLIQHWSIIQGRTGTGGLGRRIKYRRDVGGGYYAAMRCLA